MLAGLALGALIAFVVTRPKPPGPKIQVVSIGVYKWNDPLEPRFATAGFRDGQGKRTEDIPLGGTLPKPNEDWHLAECNIAGQNNNYVILQNVKTGERVAYSDTLISNPPLRPPIPFPLPPWPGVGCVGILPNPKYSTVKDENWQVLLTGGSYTSDRILTGGWMNIGDSLPAPWDRWRVKELIHRDLPTPTTLRHFPAGPMKEFACVIENIDTGQSVRLPVKQVIDLPHDAALVMPTTQPATTQPAG